MLKINDEFYVRADALQFILCRKRLGINNKTGKEVSTFVQSYHSTLKQIYDTIIRYYARKAIINNVENLNELVQLMDTKVEDIIRKIGFVNRYDIMKDDVKKGEK